MKLSKYLLFLCVVLGNSCGQIIDDHLLPMPTEVVAKRGHFELQKPIAISSNLTDSQTQILTGILSADSMEWQTANQTEDQPSLRFELSDDAQLPLSNEGYKLSVAPEGVVICSRATAGLFYGLQTFMQLHDRYGDKIPAREITDAPRFAYRGLHLDVSRHFFDKHFVKKQLRMMASLKLNRLHWHLTDAAGWRLAIDSYPRLTEQAAWRQGQTWQEWSSGDRGYTVQDDPNAYGGFYTKEDIGEVVAYADSLHITIIPEIEMPGHSDEVLAVYPQLSCRGDGRGADLCPGNEETFNFLENVLLEVFELFPSEYIHIGGDEASKSEWHECPKCCARMAHEGLSSVDELQSYLIHRIEVFLNTHDRKLLGWDEILEGGLAPGATVMSWRGEQGGRKAAASGHSVVMTPNAYCYFDSYQDNPTTEPQAMSGYLPLHKVYSYDPAPLDMVGRENVLGVQANLWTEYIPTPEHVEYMLYPRLFALAEVGWSAPHRKDYEDFRRRASFVAQQANRKGYKTFDITQEFGERTESIESIKHLAVGASVAYATPWRENYPASGVTTLTDGVRGSWSYGVCWQGFMNSDVDVTVDLGQVRRISSISADFIQWYSAWIWLPRQVDILVSNDGCDFRLLESVLNEHSEELHRPEYRSFGWEGEADARYVRYHALSNGRDGGWIFTDEIVIQ